MLDIDLVEQLKKSRTVVGEYSPIVVDFDGEILSGRHRKEASWEKTETIDSRTIAEKLGVTVAIAKEVVRTHFNLQRKPSREETQESLLKIAKELEIKGILKENITSEVAKLVPYSDRWVRELLPEEYKQPEKVEAAKIGAEVVPQKVSVKVVEQKLMPQAFQTDIPKTCSSCHVQTFFSRTKKNGDVFCSRCLESEWKKGKIEEDDLLAVGEAIVEKPKPEPKPVVKEWKPKETPEQRVAVMKPQHSRIEEDLLIKLNEAGLHPVVDHEFCIQTTTPDYYFPDKNLAIYIDGKPHENRVDRDQSLRDLLAKRHNIRVVSIAYNFYGMHEVERVFKEIMEQTK